MTGEPQRELALDRGGEAADPPRSAEADPTTHGSGRSGADDLMEQIVERSNLVRALRRVRQNQGSAGIDGMTVDELVPYLRKHWPKLREQLLTGQYRPSAVRRHDLPKPGGGVRTLGIPTVLDRFIQQAVLQVLQPQSDPTFSEFSYGFRPGRSAHDAVRQAQQYVAEGRGWVVDVDLEKFFDRVNHDVLMGKLSHRITDRRVLRLIRRYLEAGMMVNGIVQERVEGTPQGGPLSPLLANVLLDEVDKELERRGHAFVRYADDCNVYVRSERAGQRVMDALLRLYAKLRLRVNPAKSAVARVEDRQFLGFTLRTTSRNGVVLLRVGIRALRTFQERIREITSRTRGRSLSQVVARLRTYLTGWDAYFRLAEMPDTRRHLDQWIRRRLRAVILKQWRQPATTHRMLLARGVRRPLARRAAAHATRWWRTAAHTALHIALPTTHFDALGVPRLAR